MTIKSLKSRLLLWFFFYVLQILLVILVSVNFYNKRKNIGYVSQRVSQTHILLLQDYTIVRDFFIFDIKKNELYESNGQSINLTRHEILIRRIQQNLIDIQTFENSHKLEMFTQSEELFNVLKSFNFSFNRIIMEIIERGYGEYGMEGDIKKLGDQLSLIDMKHSNLIMRIRYLEKDYLVSGNPKNIISHKLLCSELRNIIKQKSLKTDKQQNYIATLDEYEAIFKKIIEQDNKIGLRTGISGIKADMDNHEKILEKTFKDFQYYVELKEEQLNYSLWKYYLITVFCIILFSLFIAIFIANRITKPLVTLAQHISRFVNSNFKVEEELNYKPANDEIGALTRNYLVLKKEIITLINYFINRVEERTEELRKINNANKRFVPYEFLQFLGHKSITDVKLGNQIQKEMTVLFSDMRSFSSMSERMTPQENFNFINEYLSVVGPIVRQHKGFIDKYIGDAIMALFENADDGLKCAIDMQRNLNDYNIIRVNRGDDPVIIGIGLHHGSLILGTIGEEERMDTTVISDAVNLASRLEGLSKEYNTCIIISIDLVMNLNDPLNYNYRYLDNTKVKGINKEVTIFEILDGLPTDEKKQRVQNMREFELAVKLFHSKEFETAKELFEKLYDKDPEDKVIKHYLKLIDNSIK